MFDGSETGGQLRGVGSGVVGVVARLVHLEVEESMILDIDVLNYYSPGLHRQ